MLVTRRNFLRSAGVGTTTALVTPALLRQIALAEPPRAAVAGGPIQLGANENAYGCFPSVAKAAAEALERANRYPFSDVRQFRTALAGYLNFPPSEVILGCGSTEILSMAACAFGGPTRKVIVAAPTFETVSDYAATVAAPLVKVPLNSKWEHDLDAMLTQAKGAGLIYICNPNNPTASLTPRRDIEAFLRKLPSDTYVLIDEAYHHFVSSPDYVSFLNRRVDDPRVIVARTFSKVYGMAGLRMGYGVAAAETIRRLQPWQLEDNVNTVAAHCAMTALQDDAAMRAAVERITADRAEFLRQAAARKIAVIPTQANFAMLETGKPVRSVIDYFRKNNILVGRPFPPLETYVRVSFGRPEEMTEFWRVWGQMQSTSS